MGQNISCCKKRGRTKSETIREDEKIEKLTNSFKTGSLSSKSSKHSANYDLEDGVRQSFLLDS